MNNLDRSLEIFADGEKIDAFGRACLSGKEKLGLFPMPWMLRLWNLSEENFLRLSRAKEVSVSQEGLVLAAGTIADVFRRLTLEGTVTHVCFSLNLSLWNAQVSFSVEAGTTVSETVRRLLEASGTGIQLLSFPGEDRVLTRGQAFFGRTAECVEEALSAVGARGYMVPAGLCVVPAEGVPVSVRLTEEDLLNAPSAAAGGLIVLRTGTVGWSVGKGISVSWDNQQASGAILERAVEADTQSGLWQAELLISIHSFAIAVTKVPVEL